MTVQVSQAAAPQLAGAPDSDADGRSALRWALHSGKLMTGTVVLAVFVLVAIIGPVSCAY